MERGDLVYGLDISATVLGAAGITLPSPSFLEGRDAFAEDHVERDRIYSFSDLHDETLQSPELKKTATTGPGDDE